MAFTGIKLGEYEEERKDTGEKIRYIIQTATPEMTDDVINHMVTFFLPREPMCKDTVNTEESSIKCISKNWKDAIAAGTTLVALQIIDGVPQKLIGVNAVPIVHQSSQLVKMEGEQYNLLADSMKSVTERSGLYEKYGVDRYMSGLGLSVDASFHGFKIGQHLLECRKPLCQTMGIKVTATLFSAGSSQHIAAKLGYDVLFEEEFADFTHRGEQPYAHIPGKIMMMGLKY